MNRFLLPLAFLPLFSISQSNVSLSSSEILSGLKKLNTTATVLYVAAHPDDENTRLLAYLANEKQVRTAYLSITRGDGGQNLIGKEQGEALGLIRTQELLAARRRDGAEQYFTRANDFGFSKNPEETFDFWNKDSILQDVVLTIRKLRPDVIVCRFPTTGEGGHGHHTASAMLALEAFTAAANADRFPQQLSEFPVWQSKRILWNTFNFGTTNTTAPDQLKMDVGVYNALSGKSYGEVASESRSMHKSQGFGSARQRGSNIEYFKLMAGDSARKDLLDGVTTSWSRLPGTGQLTKAINDCIANFKIERPEQSVDALCGIYKLLQSLDEKSPDQVYWKKIKLKETEKLMLACSGLWVESLAAESSAVPGSSLSFSLQLINRSNVNVILRSVKLYDGSDSILNYTLKNNELLSIKKAIDLPLELPYSAPYWLVEKHKSGRYTVNDKNLVGEPQNKPLLSSLLRLSINGLELELERPMEFKMTDPVKGEVYKPFEILPPVSITLPEKVLVFNNHQSKIIQISVKALRSGIKGELMLDAGADWRCVMNQKNVELATKNEEAVVEATLTPLKTAGNITLKARFKTGEQIYATSVKRIEYEHIPSQVMIEPSESQLVLCEINIRSTGIGYIPGAGDDVANSLKQVGYNVTILDEEKLKQDLSRYNAIITGVRAFNTNEKLAAHKSKLLQYVKNGGNLIVQYNTNSRVGPLQTSIGPYPFTISRDRVTNENATVVFKNEKHPALNSPNKISQSDFEGWVQERGIYFATETDNKYQTVLQMNDPNEKPHEGSLIIAPYGSGNFVYTGLAFFRQLPAGVPGAYRLFSNLLALPKNKP